MFNQKGNLLVIVGLIVLLLSIGGSGVYYVISSRDASQNKPNEITQASSLNSGLTENPKPSSGTNTELPAVPKRSSDVENGNWKTLVIDSCQISIKYPPEMEYRVYQYKDGCRVAIVNRALLTGFFAETKPNDSELSRLLPVGSKIEAVKVNGSEGKIVKVDSVDTRFWLAHGNYGFSGYYNSKLGAKDPNLELIFKSVKYLNPEDKELDPEYTSQSSFEAQSSNGISTHKVDVYLTVLTIDEYYLKNGKFPDSLSDLKDGGYFDIHYYRGKTPELFEQYKYEKQKDTFRINLILPNGATFTQSGNTGKKNGLNDGIVY